MKNVRRYLEILEGFSGVPILVVGDLILDHYIWGKVSRISPEAPVVVVNVTTESRRPGGAGNVANNLLALGAKVGICGLVGDDSDGKELVKQLESQGADGSGVIVDRTRRTSVKTRVIAQAQQVVRVDREDIHPLEQAACDSLCKTFRAHLAGTKGVIISDYAKGAISPALFQIIQQETSKGQLGYRKIPVLVDPKGPNFSLYSQATIVKPNRSEATLASGIEITDRATAIQAATALLEKWKCEIILITLGELGMVLVSKVDGALQTAEIDTVARDVYDVSGAGDTVSAVFSLALSAGATPVEAAELANIAAGIVVAEVGTVAVTAADLKQAVIELGEAS